MGYVEEIQQQFGERMRFYRKQRGLTLEDLARELKTTVSSMSRVENGKQNLSMAHIATIAETLQVPVLALFGGETVADNPAMARVAAQYHATLATLDGLAKHMASLGDTLQESQSSLSQKQRAFRQNDLTFVPQLQYA